MRRLAALLALLVLGALMSGCEMPTLFERTTYRIVTCHLSVFRNPDTLTTDSTRYEECSDPIYEGLVIYPDGSRNR